jgi:hypothetical protein
MFRGAAWWLVVALTLAAAIVPAVLWVGDISWMQDEPRHLAKAWHANANHRLETHGLNGNFGVPYGPLPTQIYQLFLLTTHDILKIAAMRAGLCAGVTAIGLLWLARSLRLNPCFALAVVLAPYVWNFHRILWDASFAIPIGTIALAAYASFLRTSSGKSLVLCALCTGALAFIHPQDLPLMLPILGHVLRKHRPALARNYIGLAIVFGVLLALNFGYFRKAYDAVHWQLTQHGGSLSKGYPGTQSRLLSLTTPFLGGEMLAGYRFGKYDSRIFERSQLDRIAVVGTLLVYPLIWLGMAVAAIRLLRRWRGADDGEIDDPADPTLRRARRAIAGIVLAGLAIQVLLYGAMRMPVAPQYFFGTFPIHVMFAWIGVDFLHRQRVGWPAVVMYGLAVAYVTIASTIYIHRVGYARNTYRPSLKSQVEVAKALNAYADETVMTDVVLFKSHPQAIRALRLLIPPDGAKPRAASGRLLVRHTTGPSGTDSAIELAEAPPGAELDPSFEELDVSPLPPEWHPAKW